MEWASRIDLNETHKSLLLLTTSAGVEILPEGIVRVDGAFLYEGGIETFACECVSSMDAVFCSSTLVVGFASTFNHKNITNTHHKQQHQQSYSSACFFVSRPITKDTIRIFCNYLPLH
jgi:hypothetical protein